MSDDGKLTVFDMKKATDGQKVPILKRVFRVCGVDGCEEEKHRREMCRKHYVRFLKWGDVEVVHRPWDVKLKKGDG